MNELNEFLDSWNFLAGHLNPSVICPELNFIVHFSPCRSRTDHINNAIDNHIRLLVFLEYLSRTRPYFKHFFHLLLTTAQIISFPFYRCTNKSSSHLPTQQARAEPRVQSQAVPVLSHDTMLGRPVPWTSHRSPSHCADVTSGLGEAK